MSKLFDHVAKALGEPKNMELLITTADAMDRRQVVRWSQAATRQMLDTLAELAADPSTVGTVQRSLALVSETDGDGPIRLVPGRFETAGASLVRSLAVDGANNPERARYAGNPLAAPVAWLLASAIGRHGPRSTDPEALALFLERERRRTIDPPASKPVGAPPPSHRSAAPVPVPLAVEPAPPALAGRESSDQEPDVEDPSQGRSPATVFAGYMLVVGAVLWLLSAILGADDLNIVLVEGAIPTAESRPALTTIPSRFTSLVTVPPVTVPVPSVPTIPSAPQAGPSGPELPQSTDLTALVDIPFTLAGPPGSSGVTGIAHVTFDAEENQICHRFEVDGIAEPFGRLGIGRSDAQAGVVVDLGMLESGQRACTQVSSTAMTAFIAAETDHFVEVGDARRVQVVRGQTSARTGGEALVAPVVEASVDAADVAVDPTIATAGLIARPGVVTLVGAAPSQATADLLRAELAVLDGTEIEVVDQLLVDPAAAPPTGTIKVDRTDLFAVDLHDLSSDGEIVARELATLFQRNPDWAITVSGHTDSTGDEINNLELGLRRANEVRDILIAEGVPAERITAEGIGAPNPIADNDTPEGRAQNRRFEIEISRP